MIKKEQGLLHREHVIFYINEITATAETREMIPNTCAQDPCTPAQVNRQSGGRLVESGRGVRSLRGVGFPTQVMELLSGNGCTTL